MTISSILHGFKKMEPHQFKLTITSDLSGVPESTRDEVFDLYRSDDSQIRLMATLLNAAFTQRRRTFLFSMRIFSELLEADPRQFRKSLDGATYKSFLFFLQKNEIIVKLRSSSNNRSTKNRGSIIEFIEPRIVQLLAGSGSETDFDGQRIKALLFHDQFDSAGSNANSEQDLTSLSQCSSHDNAVVNENGNVVEVTTVSAFGKTATPGGTEDELTSPTRCSEIFKGDSFSDDNVLTALAMTSSYQLVAIQSLLGLSENQQFQFTDWELNFLHDCLRDLKKYMRALSQKRHTKLEEIYFKARDVREAIEVDKWMGHFQQFCRENTSKNDNDLCVHYITSFGKPAFLYATKVNNLQSHRALAEIVSKQRLGSSTV